MKLAYQLEWLGKKRGQYKSLAHTTNDMAAAYNYKAELQSKGYTVTIKTICDDCLQESCKCSEWAV
jgi:hypothetical protein